MPATVPRRPAVRQKWGLEMGLLEKLRSVTPADFDRDALEFLGPDLRFSPDGLSAGGETVGLADVQAAAAAALRRDVWGSDRATDGPPPARIVICDLEAPRGP